MTNHPLASLFTNYSRNFNRSKWGGCRITIDFILNKCLIVILSWFDILLIILLNHENFGKATLWKLSRPTDQGHPSLGMTSRYILKSVISHKIIFSPIVSGHVDHGIGFILKPILQLLKNCVGVLKICSWKDCKYKSKLDAGKEWWLAKWC
jgi:hypothetical protein